MTQDDDVDAGRECVLKWLCVYLNEDPANLVREFVAEDEAAIKESIEDTTDADEDLVSQDLAVQKMKIYNMKTSTSEDPDVGIVVDGIKF
ncbi:unnamed protein product [Gadus morhua 'NCC']